MERADGGVPRSDHGLGECADGDVPRPLDDLHRRVDEVHGRVNEVRQELGRDLSDGFRSLDNRIAEQALAQKGNWLKVAGRILIILGTAAVSLFVGSLIK